MTLSPHFDLVSRLRAAGCVFAEDEAELLLSSAAGAAELDDLVARRVAGIPLEHVLGWAGFCGLRITVRPGVFVPRRRTEFLVRRAVELAPPHPVVVDLCCGSGAIGTALAAELDVAELHAADVDPEAVACARHNIGAAGGLVHEGDLYAALPASLRGRIDLLAANAPYVPSESVSLMPPEARLYEPLVALDGGPEGVDVVRRVAAGAAEWLAPGGHLLVEASEQQAPVFAGIFAGYGLRPAVATSEELGATVITGRRPHEKPPESAR